MCKILEMHLFICIQMFKKLIKVFYSFYLIDENKSVYLRGYREVLNSQSQVHIT